MIAEKHWFKWGILFLGALWLLGCNPCTKRLALYRDSEPKNPPQQMALFIADPGLAALLPGAGPYPAGGCVWAPEGPAPQSEVYRLSLDRVDGRAVYQGLCLDTTPTYSLEVHPGARQLSLRLDQFGSWGHEKKVETLAVTPEPGGVYFVQPDCDALRDRQFVPKISRLGAPYTPQLKSQVQDWNRGHYRGRTLVD
jgi:hypothetical protein